MRLRAPRIPLQSLSIGLAAILAASSATLAVAADEDRVGKSLPAESIEHVLVINLENESFNTTFSPASPATYLNGTLLLVVLTFDESGFADARACPALNQADCKSPTGPNVGNPGFSPILGLFGLQKPPTADFVYAGGSQVGAVLFNARFIEPGSVNTTGVYNHHSALRSYEDLLGIDRGGDDGKGHLGYAAVPGLTTFGKDVFSRWSDRDDRH